MPSETISTMVRMMESLPEATQRQVVDHLREYLLDLEDELRWEKTLERTQPQLAAAARRAKQQIASGEAKPLDLGAL